MEQEALVVVGIQGDQEELGIAYRFQLISTAGFALFEIEYQTVLPQTDVCADLFLEAGGLHVLVHCHCWSVGCRQAVQVLKSEVSNLRLWAKVLVFGHQFSQQDR